ncbi:glutamate--cysteine ligase [Chitinasiproducens palmae]|nr:glutamate--cysteine ligase [Chitinasiproducens palmae]
MQKTIFDDADAGEFARRLTLLDEAAPLPALGLRGVEREGLRIDGHGRLANTPHPPALGAALTHPELTTDYSEALLEFITPPLARLPQVFDRLRELHRFVAENLEHELVWPLSMPSRLPPDNQIPIAEYGASNQGRYKHVYRLGLATRYGRTMQCIAGIHFNYSIDDGLWERLRADAGAAGQDMPLATFRSNGYLALMRNFEHFGWLLLYLFGASPALHPSFLQGRHHERFDLIERDPDTLVAPHATSLRMSDLGYQNRAVQGRYRPRHDALDAYLEAIAAAVSEPYPPYQQAGVRDAAGGWLQLNGNLLQIENELYATIRPKRTTQPGERPLTALSRRGIEYVEARTLDLDPFEAVGIAPATGRFMEAFLTMCALMPPLLGDSRPADDRNFARVAKLGRRPGLTLERDGDDVALRDWGLTVLDQVAAVADRLDLRTGGDAYRQAVARQRAKLDDVSLTPSAQVLAALEDGHRSFIEFGVSQALKFATTLKNEGSSVDTHRRLSELAEQSIAAQRALETDPAAMPFDDYVAALSGPAA